MEEHTQVNESIDKGKLGKVDDSLHYEEPEGIDEVESIDLGEYPIDSVLIRSETRTVYEVVRRIRADQYILDPDFQRDFVWNEYQQSRLIESALMRIPLPVFYLAEQEDGRIVVVDGLQRLMTFNRYLNNDFAIKGLNETGVGLNGKRFNDLSPKFQNRIEDTNLTLYLIDSKVPERARLDIFERVNSGVPLSRQQMRNCLYVGPATRWLRKEASIEYFLQATGRSLNPKTMRDRELINRFCAFYLLGVNAYRGDMDYFLADALRHMNNMSNEELANLSNAFQTSMQNNYEVFKRQSFRKHYGPQYARSIINASLFDVFSVLMAGIDHKVVIAKSESIKNIFYKLMVNDEFARSITLSTNSTARVINRFMLAKMAFEEL